MFDFRKVLLASVAGLGLVATASAQVPTCTVLTGATAYVAVEGTTEQVAAMQLNCTNANQFSGPFNLTLTANAPITNQTLTAAPKNVDISVVEGADAVSTITQPAANQVTITFNTVTPTANAGATMSFLVTGLRVNPSGAPVGSTITVTPSSTTVTIASSPANWAAGFVSKTLNVVALNSSTINAGLVPANLNLCSDTGTVAAPGTGANSVGVAANLSVSANFLDALKSVGDYTNPNTATTGANGNAVTAKLGTVLAVTFNNLNAAGVSYYVPTSITGTNMTLTAYTTAPTSQTSVAATSISAGALLTSILNAWNAPYTAITATAPTGAVLLTVASGSATIYYEVSATTQTALESGLISLAQNVGVPTAVTSFPSGPVTVSVSLAGAASPAYPGISSSQTAYSASPAATNTTNGQVAACATTLLFPYVTNASTFDTGIAISNASTGIGSTILAGGAAIPSTSGNCTLTFYGTVNGTAPTTAPTTTVTVATGTVQSVDVGSTTGLAGFSGYAVASCNFVGGHGYAFLFTTSGGGLAADYLAPIISAGSLGYNPNGGGAAGNLNPIF